MQISRKLLRYHTEYAQFDAQGLDDLKLQRLDKNIEAMVQALSKRGIPCTTQGVGSGHDGTHVRHLDGSYELNVQFKLDGTRNP